MNVFSETEGGDISLGFRMGIFEGFGEGGDGRVESLVFTTSKDNLNRLLGIDESGEVFKNGVGTFTAGNNEKSEGVGVEFELATNFFLIVGLLELLANEPTRSDNFLSGDTKIETSLDGLGVEDEVVGVRMRSDGRNSARIGNDVNEGERMMFLLLMDEVIVCIETGNDSLRFLGTEGLINKFFIGDFRVRADNFLYRRDGAKFKGDFEKMREKSVEGGIEFELLAAKIIEVGRKFLLKILFDSLGNTEMAFGGGEDGSSGFFVVRKDRHVF